MDFIGKLSLCIIVVLLADGETRPQKVLKRSKRNHVNCRPNSLVRYRLTVDTEWSKETFPKMYPTYRPHAQWSALVGRSHGPEYTMWEEGANATLGAKLFAEQGDASQLDMEAVQGYDHILDSFVAPPVNKGVGQTSTIVMLDGHNSRLSFMIKIIPSPDWFIGVNSLDLCAHGRWKNKVHVDLTPFDAGTDQGLTFTAPNWPNAPQLPISAITSSYPDHPASSFYYPEAKKLPRLAYLELDIVSEYRHRETFMKVLHHYNASRAEKDEAEKHKKAKSEALSTTTVKMDSKQPLSAIFNRPDDVASNDRRDNSVNEGISAVLNTLGHYNTSWIKNTEETALAINRSVLKTIQDKESEMYAHSNKNKTSLAENVERVSNPTENTELRPSSDSIFGSNSQLRGYFTHKTSDEDNVEESVRNNAADSTNETSKLRHVFKMDDLLRKSTKVHWKQDSTEATRKAESILSVTSVDYRPFKASTRTPAGVYEMAPVDCEVSEWSEWSECSQSCGFGQQERTRDVSRYPRNGGANCPRLRQTNLCGSMRNCQWNHFSFLAPNVTNRQLREGRSRRPRPRTSKISKFR